MTRLHTDGAEYGDTLFWDTATANVTVVASGLAIGAYCYQVYNEDGYAIKNFSPALTEIYWRQRYKCDAPSARPIPNVWPNIRKSSTVIASMKYNGNYPALYIGSTPVATDTIALVPSQWYLMEVHFKMAQAGIFETKLDGMPWLSYSGDTRNGQTNFDNFYYVGSNENYRGYANSIWLDDLAFNDVNGAEDNSWPGGGFIEAYMPTWDGDALQWTPTSGSHWQNVDERPHDVDATYLQALTDAIKQDLLHLTGFPTNRTIYRVFTEARMRDVNGGLSQVKLGFKTGGNLYKSANKILPANYARVIGDEHRVNPATGLAWTESDLDAIQVLLETDSL